ncbi:hypothetical protein [Larkinella soli]|nr:hypothetical protein [Larkinella soli]
MKRLLLLFWLLPGFRRPMHLTSDWKPRRVRIEHGDGLRFPVYQ